MRFKAPQTPSTRPPRKGITTTYSKRAATLSIVTYFYHSCFLFLLKKEKEKKENKKMPKEKNKGDKNKK